jgi:Cof subfamily protein (haloacid dehalogenase superfamily)
MIELVCLDVDGTLVGEGGRVPPEVWPAAARVRDAGVRIALCTGRPALGLARAFADRLDGDGWHVFQNGASVVHLPSGRSRSSLLPPEAVEALVALAGTSGWPLELYSDTEYAVESTGRRAVEHAGLLGEAFVRRGFGSLNGPVVRAQWLVGHDEVGEVVAAMAGIGGLHVSPSLSPVMPDTTFVNLTAAGVDKALAVRALAEEYGIPLDRVMMVGDGNNDLGVMRAVGVAVAMGNAEPEVFAVAHHVVGHVDAGGLVEALALVPRL